MHYSKIAGVVAWSGGTIVLREGQSIDDDHPLLKECPQLFRSGEQVAELQSHEQPTHIETAANTGPGNTTRVRRQ